MAALGLYFVALVRTSWVADDAFITLRVVDNALHGYGPRWNVDERVQVYTHPLWFLALTIAVACVRDAYPAALVLCAVASLATVGMLAWRFASRDPAIAAGLIVALALSRAFVDYSTSGLENPLSHLLLASFILLAIGGEAWTDRRLALLSLLAGLLVTNRMDAVILVAPALGYRLGVQRTMRSSGIVLAGFAPFLLWEIFAIVYYGSPWPNAAFAKLNTGIPAGEMVGQGTLYLVDALRRDPISPALIAAGLAAALTRPRRPMAVAIGCGLAAYVAYVVRIGGDFMAGRFLTAPLLVGAVLLAERLLEASRRPRLVVGGALLALGAIGVVPPLVGGVSYAARDLNAIGPHGIADERRYYFPSTGLFGGSRGVPRPSPADPWVNAGLDLRRNHVDLTVAGAVGLLGYHAGPRVHIVDFHAVTDPFLSRLPAELNDNWRIGHFRRAIPAGYLASLVSGANRFADPALGQAWRRVERITRGPIFAADRWRDVLALALGGADRPKTRPPAAAVPWAELIGADPKNAEARYKSALEQAQGGDDDRAQTLLESALAVAPEHERALVLFARIRDRRGDVRAARGLIDRALALAPSDPDAVRVAASVAASEGDEGAAIVLLLRTAALDPASAGRAYGQIGMLKARRDASEALLWLQKAAPLADGDPEALYDIGVIYERLGRKPEARAQYERALAVDPTFVPAATALRGTAGS